MRHVIDGVKRDVSDFAHLNPHVQFILLFQLIVLFILSILIGILFSPHFKDGVRNHILNSDTMNMYEKHQW